MKFWMVLGWGLCVGFLATSGFAQVVNPPGNRNDQETEELADPEVVTMATRDRVALVATYFAGPSSKETMPIILIHDWDGDRKQLFPFAEYLREELKASVLVPDLRGHGDSIRLENSDEKIDRGRFRKAEIASAVQDIERCKKFLMAQNNEGKLNIELLTVIAVGETAVHAVQWCINDWAWPLTAGGLKQGQDVKMLVLVNPATETGGISLIPNLKMPLMSGQGMPPLPLQIVWAHRNSKAVKQSKEIYNEIVESRDNADDPVLYMTKVDNSSQSGTGLLNNPDERREVQQRIAAEIRNKILANRELLVWQNRDR